MYSEESSRVSKTESIFVGSLINIHYISYALEDFEPPSDGFVDVVCFHGFPDTPYSFERLAQELAVQGYRVHVPYMPGYHLGSLMPEKKYYITSIINELKPWLKSLSSTPPHVIGHDWGAVIGWVLAHGDPSLLRTYTSIAIPPLAGLGKALPRMPRQWVLSSYMYLFQVPKVAEYIVSSHGGWFLGQLWQRWSPSKLWKEQVGLVKRNMSHRDILTATLAYYRCMFRWFAVENIEARSLLERELSLPVCCLHGVEDGCMDYRLYDQAIKHSPFLSPPKYHLLEGVGHFLHLEQPEYASKLLIQFWRDADYS